MKCDACKQEMMDRVGCTLTTFSDFADGIVRDRVPADRDCHDCLAPAGTMHHPGCDSERCPKCQRQALSCHCAGPSEDEQL